MARFSGLTRGLSNDRHPKLGTAQLPASAVTDSSLVANSPVAAASGNRQRALRDVVSVRDYGAKGDAATDDTTAIQNAIAALPASGGTLLFPGRGSTYLYSGQLNLNGTIGVKFQGQGGMSAGAATTSRLIYTGTTSGPITGGSSYGLEFSDLQIGHTGNMARNYLVDLRRTGANDTAYVTFRRCNVTGVGVSSANTLVALDRVIVANFYDCLFANAACLVRGREANSRYSNVVNFYGCAFVAATAAPIFDPGESWNFYGCTFEPLQSGAATAIALQSTSAPWAGGTPLKNLGLYGCWLGDANATGTWVSVAGEGIASIGSRYGAGAIALGINGLTRGLTFTGNTIDTTTNIMSVAAAAHTDWHVMANSLLNGAGNIQWAAGSIPDRSFVHNPGDHFYQFGTMPLVAGAVSDASFPAAPPNGTMAYDSTNLQLYMRSGGVWKKSAAFT